jgi:hypothetical protein
LVNLAGGTAAVAATPTPSTSNDDAGEVVMVLLVWCARGAAGVLQCLLHLGAGRRVLPTQPRHRLSPLMHCKLKLLPNSHFSGMVAWPLSHGMVVSLGC